MKDIKELKTVIPEITNIKENLEKSLYSRYKNNKNKERIIDYFDELSNIYIRSIIPNDNKLNPKINF